MALDRQSIERRDFPIGRRGYDIEAVDAHLAWLADEYDELTRRGRSTSGGGLASSAADQVRTIVEAAEQSAADIEREAQLEARQLRQDAREEAERLRGDAGRQAREHVAGVAEVARGLLDRVEGMDRELGGLLDGLRAGTQRLSADLTLLQASVEAVREAAAPDPADGGDAVGAGAVRERHTELPAVDGAPVAMPGREPAEALDDHSAIPPPAPVPVGSAPAEASVDAVGGSEPAAWEPDEQSRGERDGARMVALNMALNGVPREDTRQHIEDNFGLEDVHGLLDEVYARAGQ